MKAHVYLYPTAKARISAFWSNAGAPGWPNEGGGLSFHEPNDADGGVTIYLDYEQAKRLGDLATKLVAQMDTAGAGLDGVRLESPGRPRWRLR